MKISRFFKKLAATKGTHQVDVLHVRLSCDGIGCDSAIEWEGTEKQAEAKISLHGWNLGRTGIVRCSACYKNYGHTLYEALKTLPRSA